VTDRIDFGGEPWQAIPRRVLRNERLSPAAKGGLVTLLSHEEGWVRSCIATLMNENRVGRVGARSIMRELVHAGYARLEQVRRDHGQFGTAYTVYAISQTEAVQLAIAPEAVARPPVETQKTGPEPPSPPGAGSPGAVARGAGHTPAVVDPRDVDPQDEEPKIKPSTPRKRDAIADALARAERSEPLEVPASRMRTLCVKANELRKVAPNVTPEEVARRATNWSSHMGDATITGPAVVTHWARLGAAGTSPNGRPPRDRAAEIFRDAVGRRSRGSLPG